VTCTCLPGQPPHEPGCQLWTDPEPPYTLAGLQDSSERIADRILAHRNRCVCGHTSAQHHPSPSTRCRACPQCPAFSPEAHP